MAPRMSRDWSSSSLSSGTPWIVNRIIRGLVLPSSLAQYRAVAGGGWVAWKLASRVAYSVVVWRNLGRGICAGSMRESVLLFAYRVRTLVPARRFDCCAETAGFAGAAAAGAAGAGGGGCCCCRWACGGS